MENLIANLLLLLLGWAWLDALRAREMAIGLARRACAKSGVQLLDQAVALRRLSLRWTRQGVRVHRRYRFEFSEEGIGRRQGHVILTGLRLESLTLDMSEHLSQHLAPDPDSGAEQRP
ncbi:DUF3301 domain-containing protein [Thiohalocapsa marina]|uniref:DUF3301 domain-containing protein n=1 Tax=Thiohalocapsa marina TaxID=424902 RepID=A0A5M8FGR5_9GAMM|nr:DUF3301 domain-containing protein [Thiohalocapsa marina]